MLNSIAAVGSENDATLSTFATEQREKKKKNAPLTNTVESLGAVLNSISVFLFHLPRLTGFSLTLLVGLLPNLKGDISGEREGH